MTINIVTQLKYLMHKLVANLLLDYQDMFISKPLFSIKKGYLFSVFLVCQLSFAAWAEDNTEAMATQLIELRGQVEDLQSELQILQSEQTQTMAYLNTRKAELNAQLDRQQLMIKQAERDLANTQTQIQALGADSAHMVPDVINMIDQLMASIEVGIPFKHLARQEVLQHIKRNLVADKITAQQAINQMWAFVEDELRLTQENGLYSQTIALEGEDVLVEVAKLGTALMYFKTKQNQYGHALKANDGSYSFKLFESESQKQAVANLFDSLQKQIRQGLFELPISALLKGAQQ